LSKIRQNELSESESQEHQILMMSAVAFENIGDVIETNLAELSEQEIGIKYTKSEETSRLTKGLYIVVRDSLDLIRQAIRNNDMDAARQILDFEYHINKLRHDLMVRKSSRLGSSNQDAITMARIEISVASKLMRIYNLTKNIAAEMVSGDEKQ
jgi:Na+/phosphate symporter